MSQRVVIERRLYLTKDRKRVVEEGDPEGYWLWAAPGQAVERSEAERLGAIKTEPEVKQMPAPADKQRPMPTNKAR